MVWFWVLVGVDLSPLSKKPAVNSHSLYSFRIFYSFLASLGWNQVLYVALSKRPRNQFKPAQQSRQQGLRAYCSKIYTVISGYYCPVCWSTKNNCPCSVDERAKKGSSAFVSDGKQATRVSSAVSTDFVIEILIGILEEFCCHLVHCKMLTGKVPTPVGILSEELTSAEYLKNSKAIWLLRS